MEETASDRVKLKFARRSLGEIERGKRDWLAQRDKNPELFEEELAEAIENIKAIPAFGSPTGMLSRGRQVRRVEMRKTKYQVYYRQEGTEWVVILCVWAGKRRTKPKLK